MQHLLRALAALVLLLLLSPASALAQESSWSELRTERFAILYADGDDATAHEYAGFVDTIYDELSAVFGHRTATPVTLRLYPSLERYYEINPLARALSGIVAHADFRRHEVVVIVPQTSAQTPDEVQNNIRHELTHIIAADLSEDRLNVMLQEGLAQYAEHPSRELEQKHRLLEQALADGKLMGWSDMDDRDIFYRNAQISYPQSLSVVAFLIERSSFAKLRDLLTISARSSGYRSAMERTFGVAPDRLEQEWRDWLPSYLAGGYRRNVLTAYDLSQAQELLHQGRYDEARQELENAISWLQTTNQAEVLTQAQELLTRSQAGIRATTLAQDARTALIAADYPRAAELVGQARAAYAALDDHRQDAVLADYAARAERGQHAQETFTQAQELARSLRYPEARTYADQALVEFRRLGATEHANAVQALRATLDQRQSLLGALLLALGVGGTAASIWRRLAVREGEVW